ncbi:MAG: GNAT family N-acetyltransferase [Erysipelotrichaceae bacterium]|uniref:GNAT family N-acetyltransferase n=1 Tax=Floccifex sp. TaxID=2815810 RepID=UPI002A75977E|nr:GNAT family N-acetyltransferase [Floccifex sp.]MDD7281822.1 GNAT family N-acetyltransferase [Erysipelotrichaceae bacterium]MDY2958507.1 GNAT family N-acetyltransferase [Floccifex sp.]
MRFETNRLILRPWSIQDAVDLYQQAKNPNVGPMAGWPVHTSVENSKEIIEKYLSGPLTYAICLKDNKIIGSIELQDANHLSQEIGELEIGYWIGQEYWGNEYTVEAMKCLIQYAFDELESPGLWCGYYDENHKSKRVMEKCGFMYHHSEKEFKEKKNINYMYLKKEDLNYVLFTNYGSKKLYTK